VLVFLTARAKRRLVVDVFWAHSPLLGLINILPQLLAVLATIATFARLDRSAAWCLAPLAGWVASASVLYFSLWWLNG
jgi:benzodiazapine receptor